MFKFNPFTQKLDQVGGNIGDIVTNGTNGSILFVGDGKLAQSNADFFWDNTNKRLGLGVTDPAQQLELTKSIELVNTFASDEGVIYKNGVRFIHNFQHPTGDTAIPIGKNTFIGEEAGNFTMGSTATNISDGSRNVGIGNQALKANTTGHDNVGIGSVALLSNTEGFNNFALGATALQFNTTGDNNVGVGFAALLFNSTGDDNVGVGRSTLLLMNSGSKNTAVGKEAGFLTGDGVLTTSNNSLFIGAESKALTNNSSNEIVIGYNTTGIGSNTVTLGNNSIVTTALKGNVRVGIADNNLLLFGAGQDASITYDGTNMLVNPKVIGSGNLTVQGTLKTDEGRIQNVTTVNSATYDLLITDHIVHVTYTSTGAVTSLTLPSAQVVAGRTITIKDAGGNSGTNSITVDTEGAETIDGENTLVIDSNYRSKTLYSDGSNWFIRNDYSRRALERTYSFSSPIGGSGVYYIAGFYEAPSADANLTQASPSIAYGTANISHASHPFIVPSGAGSVDTGQVGLRVSGTTIDNNGVRTPTTTDIITDDITTLSANTYYEAKKFIGQVTFQFYVVSGTPTTYSLDFNYGLAKYEDFANVNFQLEDFEIVGRAGANDTGFNVELLHHQSTGWTYSAAAFIPGNSSVCSMNTDHGTEQNLANGEPFAYKRANLTTIIAGGDSEGIIVRITTSANNAVETADITVGGEEIPN